MKKVKLVSLDNKKSAGQRFVGNTNLFNYDGIRFYFGSLYSSRVKSIVVNEDGFVAVTKNSVYTFEYLKEIK